MLSMRMRWDGHKHPFGFITAHKTADKVVVFFVQKDEPGYVMDAWDLYPSDTLITQLRLVLG